jgi:hypothetical protein
MKIDFSPRSVRWYRLGIETVSTVKSLSCDDTIKR